MHIKCYVHTAGTSKTFNDLVIVIFLGCEVKQNSDKMNIRPEPVYTNTHSRILVNSNKISELTSNIEKGRHSH